MAITQVITTLPTAPDPATDTRDEFSTKAAAYVLAQKAMVPELNTWAGQVNAIAATAVGDVATAIGAAAADTPVDADEFCWRKTATGILKKITWANIKATLGAGLAFTGGINEKLSTIASATTPDIFALTVGNVVDYTGTATCTGFVAAPQAGARRTLVCAGAASFTASANMLIEGVTSGANLTCAAGVQVDVVAVTTTQFRLTFTPVSGTFTPTITSGSGTITTASATLSYTRIKDRCIFNVAITITTNGTGATDVQFTLPLAPLVTGGYSFVGRETAVTGNQLFGYIASATGVLVNISTGTYPAADGYILRASGVYQIA